MLNQRCSPSPFRNREKAFLAKRCLWPQPKQGGRIFFQRIRKGAEKATGNPLFLVLRARRACIREHRSLSRALSLKVHVGSTPSGPGLSGKNSNIASGISRLCRYYETVERLVAANIKTFLTPKINSLERSLNHFFSGKQEMKCY